MFEYGFFAGAHSPIPEPKIPASVVIQAQEFSNHYQSSALQNYGYWICLLRSLLKEMQLVNEDFLKFLNANKAIFSSFPHEKIIDSTQLELLWSKLTIDSKLADIFDKLKSKLQIQQDLKFLTRSISNDNKSSAYALYADLGLLELKSEPHYSHGITEPFKQYPFQPVVPERKIFAGPGPKEGIKQFLMELIQHSVAAVVALGEPEADFNSYFYTGQNSFVYEENGEDFKIITDAVLVEKKEKYAKYALKITKSFDSEELDSDQECDIFVYHINTVDGNANQLSTADWQQLLAELKKFQKQNRWVGVHCQAGLGRTGDFILNLELNDRGEFIKIFGNKDPEIIKQKLKEKVASLRTNRPRTILEPEQLWQPILNAVELYLQQVLNDTLASVPKRKIQDANFATHSVAPNKIATMIAGDAELDAAAKALTGLFIPKGLSK